MNAPRRFVASAGLTVLVLAGCKGLPELEPLRAGGSQGGPGRQLVQPVPPGPVAPAAQDPLATIARYEDARLDGDGLLQVYLAQGDEPVRERAAVALGRLPYPELGAEVTRSLARALDDESARVRAATAYALGQRGDPSAEAALRGRWEAGEADATARARLVEASSRLVAQDGASSEAAVLRERTLQALEDKSPLVRAEAALAPHRWKTDAPGAADVDRALVAAALRGLPPKAAAVSKGAVLDTELAWRALFSLARRKCVAARDAFVQALSAQDARLRLHAAMGLAVLPYEEASQRALEAALGDDDQRVVCEAVRAIGAHPDARTPEALERALAHPSPHVQRLAFEAWGNVPKEQRPERSLNARALLYESLNVRNAAFVSAAKLEGEGARAAIELRAEDKEPLARAAAAEAARHVTPASALPLLLRLAQDDDVRVVEAACESLGTLNETRARQKLVELLSHADNGVRLAALEALKAHPSAADLAALGRCFDTSHGEIADEIAFNVLEHAAKIAALANRTAANTKDGGSARSDVNAKEAASADGGDSVDRETREGCMRLLARGLAHGNPYVRRRASDLFRATFPDRALPMVTVARSDRVHTVPLPGLDYDPAQRTQVRVETTRGAMTFELFPGETPVHVASFLRRVQDRFYDGTTFHRVVPDFVIQGGDQRGDGNGGSSWRGDSLRAEFTPRKFVRGSLGMPRNDDPDSGGSQLFVCHRETPHLDGRYTLFGELVEGFDVLDKIEVGDKIVSVRVLGHTGTR
ncbi:MAG: peptidylprolyl isomerase [Planctomycetes bacterium]|nr:peptidylprolyl isomerase [Planctomycetota bacterium]